MTRRIPVLSQPSPTKPPAPMSPPFRTCSRPSSNPEMIHFSGMSSQDSNVESRAESLPQPPTPSPQNPRISTQLLTISYPSRISLTSTVIQALTDQPRYVARFWRIDRIILSFRRFRILVVGKVSPCNARPSPGQTDGIIDHREARGNPRSSTLLSGWTCRCVFGPILFSIYSMRLFPPKTGYISESVRRHQVHVSSR